MSQFFSLCKILFLAKYKSDKTQAKANRTWVIFLVLGIVFLPVVIMLCVQVADYAPQFQARGLLLYFNLMIYMILMLVIVFFGIVAMLTYVYFNRDSEFLASLPVKGGKVFLAKLFMVYVGELVLSVVTIIPLGLSLGIPTGQGVAYYIMMLLAIFFVPAIPLLLSSLIAIPLMYVVSFFRGKSALTSIVLILLLGGFFALYYVFYFKFLGSATDENIESSIEALTKSMSALLYVLYPLTCLLRFGYMEGVFGLPAGGAAAASVNLALSIVSIALIILIAGVIANLVYSRSVLKNVESKQSDSKKEVSFKSGGSIFRALLAKEWRTMFRETSFAFQCLSGTVLAPIIVVVMTIMFNDSIKDMAGDIAQAQLISKDLIFAIIVMMIMMVGAGMNITASTALSREGKNFYITKVVPVPYKTQIQAKLVLSLIINMSATLLACIIAFIILRVPVLNSILGIVFLLIYAVVFAQFALWMDLRRPKLNWSAPNEAVKNSRNATVPMLINLAASFIAFALIFVPTVLAASFNIPALSYIGWAFAIALGIGGVFLFRHLLFNNLDAKYESIEM